MKTKDTYQYWNNMVWNINELDYPYFKKPEVFNYSKVFINKTGDVSAMNSVLTTSSPTQLDCGSSCVGAYETGSSVTLSLESAENAVFGDRVFQDAQQILIARLP